MITYEKVLFGVSLNLIGCYPESFPRNIEVELGPLKNRTDMLRNLHSSNCEWSKNGVVRKLRIVHVEAHLRNNKQ